MIEEFLIYLYGAVVTYVALPTGGQVAGRIAFCCFWPILVPALLLARAMGS